MKKILLSILIIFIGFSVNAQSSMGSPVMFPDGSLYGSAFKPRIAFYIDTEPTVRNYFALIVTKPRTYVTYDRDSRILIKFEDGSKFTLPIWYEVQTKDFDYIGDVATYSVTTLFEIKENDIITKILNSERVVKIRIVYSNGDIDDYEIEEFYQNKFIRKLINSYNEAVSENSERKKNMNDDDF